MDEEERVITMLTPSGEEIVALQIETFGRNKETEPLIELIPSYIKCEVCQKYLAKKEEEIRDVTENTCVDCFQEMIEFV